MNREQMIHRPSSYEMALSLVMYEAEPDGTEEEEQQPTLDS